MMSYLYVFVGGGLGSTLRFWISQKYNQELWPIGTFIANIMACIILGFAIQKIQAHDNHWIKWMIVSGFCGGLSTFSSLIFEMFQYINHGKLVYALGYLIISIIVSIPCLLIGYKL
jgi:fluoride exporter